MAADPTTPAMPTLTRGEIAKIRSIPVHKLWEGDVDTLLSMALQLLDLREGVERLATEWTGKMFDFKPAEKKRETDMRVAVHAAIYACGVRLRALPHVAKEKTDGK